MGKVYIISNVDHKYDTAEKFGELEVISRKFPIFNPENTVGILDRILNEFTIDDYFLVDGSPILSMYIFAFLLNKVQNINLLLYDAKKQEYVHRNVDKALFQLY